MMMIEVTLAFVRVRGARLRDRERSHQIGPRGLVRLRAACSSRAACRSEYGSERRIPSCGGPSVRRRVLARGTLRARRNSSSVIGRASGSRSAAACTSSSVSASNRRQSCFLVFFRGSVVAHAVPPAGRDDPDALAAHGVAYEQQAVFHRAQSCRSALRSDAARTRPRTDLETPRVAIAKVTAWPAWLQSNSASHPRRRRWPPRSSRRPTCSRADRGTRRSSRRLLPRSAAGP